MGTHEDLLRQQARLVMTKFEDRKFTSKAKTGLKHRVSQYYHQQ